MQDFEIIISIRARLIATWLLMMVGLTSQALPTDSICVPDSDFVELPVQVEKSAAAGMEKSIKRLDDEITKVRNYCIAGTIAINVLLVLLALQILM